MSNQVVKFIKNRLKFVRILGLVRFKLTTSVGRLNHKNCKQGSTEKFLHFPFCWPGTLVERDKRSLTISLVSIIRLSLILDDIDYLRWEREWREWRGTMYQLPWFGSHVSLHIINIKGFSGVSGVRQRFVLSHILLSQVADTVLLKQLIHLSWNSKVPLVVWLLHTKTNNWRSAFVPF